MLSISNGGVNTANNQSALAAAVKQAVASKAPATPPAQPPAQNQMQDATKSGVTAGTGVSVTQGQNVVSPLPAGQPAPATPTATVATAGTPPNQLSNSLVTTPNTPPVNPQSQLPNQMQDATNSGITVGTGVMVTQGQNVVGLSKQSDGPQTPVVPSGTSQNQPPTQKQLQEAEKLGINVGKGATGAQLQDVVDQLNKLPPDVRSQVAKKDWLDLVAGGSVTNDPQYKDLKGKQTTSLGDGNRTYDQVEGVSDAGKVVLTAKAINEDLAGTGGSVDTVLHETGHAFDYDKGGLSSDPAWQTVWDKLKSSHYFNNAPQFSGDAAYYNQNANEAFAETFANYFDNSQTRAALPPIVQKYFSNLA